MGKDLDISTSSDFVKDRSESTEAVQAAITTTWQWSGKTLLAWQADNKELDGSVATSLMGKFLTEDSAFQGARGALEGRLRRIKEANAVAVGVMRVRAKQNLDLAQAVKPLKANAKSNAGIEKEGVATLATWTTVFTDTFIPTEELTLADFQELFDGDDSDEDNIIPSLAGLKAAHKQAEKKRRLAKGKLNRLISRLEDECTQWYAEATSVFRRNTAEGAMIRGTVPTSDDYNVPTGAPVPITISSATATGANTVLIVYATEGGGGATSRKLQWRFSSGGDWTEYGTVIRPEHIVSHGGWTQQTVVFRVEVKNTKGTEYGPEVTVGM